MGKAKKSARPTCMWTAHGSAGYDFYITRGKGVYGALFKSAQRTFEPKGFDYEKKIREEVDKLDYSGEDLAEFPLVGMLEDTWAEDGKLKGRFLMPGHLNRTWTFSFDPQKQDFEGKLGLQINCLIRRVDVPIPAFCKNKLDPA